MRLLRRDDPRDGESLMGYVLRMTELNGYETPTWIVRAAGLEHEQLKQWIPFTLDPGDSLGGLARLCGTRTSELNALAYPRVSQYRHLFYGAPVHVYVLRPSRPKICPECVEEKGHCLRAWDLSLVTVCPRHDRLLLDQCPKCRERLAWLRGGLVRCRCGYDLRRSPENVAGPTEAALTRLIYRRCGMDAPPVCGSGEGHTPVYTLDLDDLLQAVVFIAGQFRGRTGATGKHLPRAASNAELHALFARAFAVFDRWPHNYFGFLDWQQTRTDDDSAFRSSGDTGLMRSFGRFYEGLYKRLGSSRFDFMRTAFDEYAREHWGGGYLLKSKRFRVETEGGYVTRAKAARLLKIDNKFVDHLVAARRLEAVVRTTGKQRIYLVEKRSLERVKKEYESYIGVGAVVSELGVSRLVVEELIRNESLRPLRGPTVDGCHHWSFAPGAAAELIGSIREMIDPRARREAAESVGFASIPVRLIRSGAPTSVARLVRLVLDGVIRPCAENETKIGLYRFAVPIDDLRRYVASAGPKAILKCA